MVTFNPILKVSKIKMNTFRTEINCSPASPIGLDHKILTIGSCFADQFGQWLINNKFTVLANPFGTTYNPVSIHNLLVDVFNKHVDSDLVTERNGLWFHHNWHSQFTATSKTELLAELQRVQKQIHAFLQEVDVVIITYGTAFFAKDFYRQLKLKLHSMHWFKP